MYEISMLLRFILVFAGLLARSGIVVRGLGIGSVAFSGLCRFIFCGAGGAELDGGGGVACRFMLRGL